MNDKTSIFTLNSLVGEEHNCQKVPDSSYFLSPPPLYCILLNDIANLNFLSIGTLVPTSPYFMKQGINFTKGLARMAWFLLEF